VARLRLFEAFEDTVSVVLKAKPKATPDAAVVQAIAIVEEIIGASGRVAMRDVISAAVRHVARFVRDPHIMNRLMSYAGIMCSEPSRVALMRLMAQSDVLSVELREWAREWSCIIGHPKMLQLRGGPEPQLFAGGTKFKYHRAQPLVLPLELLFREASNFFEAVDRELLDIPCLEMQDRLFQFFLGFAFDYFFEDEGFAFSQLVEQQLRRRSFSEVASRLSASQCMTNAPEFTAEDDLTEILLRVYSNVSQVQRNEAVYAVLAVKRSDGRYRANCGVFGGAIFLMRVLFESGASPLVRDASGVLLIANVRCLRLRSLVNGKHRVVELSEDPDVCGELESLVEEYMPRSWTVESHHLFPDDFRARVRQLLLCNQRFEGVGAPHLSMDPLELVIQWLAVGEVLGEDAIEREMAKLEVGNGGEGDVGDAGGNVGEDDDDDEDD
jgi:hypothetical protein